MNHSQGSLYQVRKWSARQGTVPTWGYCYKTKPQWVMESEAMLEHTKMANPILFLIKLIKDSRSVLWQSHCWFSDPLSPVLLWLDTKEVKVHTNLPTHSKERHIMIQSCRITPRKKKRKKQTCYFMELSMHHGRWQKWWWHSFILIHIVHCGHS